jgi:hypothetical protein
MLFKLRNTRDPVFPVAPTTAKVLFIMLSSSFTAFKQSLTNHLLVVENKFKRALIDA